MPAPEGYIDVNQRIEAFYAKHPEGSLQQYSPPVLMEANGKTFVAYTAAAYRTPDDPRPGIGTAWEPVPGPTPFTKDSELMNAETSAWGRAIAARGFEVRRGIATQQDVDNRTGASGGNGKALITAGQVRLLKVKAEQKQMDLAALIKEFGVTKVEDLPSAQVNAVLQKLGVAR